MQDACFVDDRAARRRTGGRSRAPSGFVQRSAAREHVVEQGLALEPLHDEVRGPGLFEHLVDANDAGMGEASEHCRLAR